MSASLVKLLAPLIADPNAGGGGNTRHIVTTKRCPPDSDFLLKDESHDRVHVILDGWARCYNLLRDGRCQVLSYLIPGDVCVASGFHDDDVIHNFSAVTHLKIALITRAYFRQMRYAETEIGKAIARRKAAVLSIQREWTTNLGSKAAFEHLAHFFCEIFFRMRAAGLVDANRCDFPLTQAEISAATGMTPVHVSRTISQIRKDGLIQFEQRSFVIPDLERLMAAAMFDPAYLLLDGAGAHAN